MAGQTVSQHLIEWAELSAPDVAKIEAVQGKKRVGFLHGALETGVIDESQYVEFLAERLNMPAADPSKMVISDKILEIVARDLLVKYRAVPFFVQGTQLFLASSEPEDILAVDDIRFMTGMEPIMHVAAPGAVHKALERVKDERDSGFGTLQEAMSDMAESDLDVSGEDESGGDTASTLEAASAAPVVKMVNLIIMDAIRRKASDIHIEPYEKDFRVRFRSDGMLQEVMQPPARLKNALISRLKIMAHLNIAEKRLPQDGRIKVRTPSGKEIEFRVSILPTLFGEKVVMRLLDKSALKVDMTQLGLEEKSLTAIKTAINRPYGMFLVTGPTGSGKTTTLYSALMELNKEDVNISTAEDPVEFSVHGINQVQVKEDVGLTFAAALRSFLRQDPDIILVGEIRDLETAEIAIKAALTGHLVLSTLHTNDAPSTLTRLLNMGVDGFLVASSVNAIVAQRLIRKLCAFCKRKVDMDPEFLVGLGFTPEEARTVEIFEPVGCPECNNVGYKGRSGLYEVLTVTEEIQELILRQATVLEIRDTALSQGMLTMRQSGLTKLANGMTSVQEILRVTV
ncbi:MAG: type IV-A pilus assembly ATPase PilB [Deltaproteobacteria bacterium]|nr:type IV-A pilus assembly ATPase PilB [Deltaproteobacteria bacterium]